VAELRRFRIDDGTAEEPVVLFPGELVVPFPPVCVPSSTSLLEVGISMKGVTP
jgi:hypothetical protein